MKKTLIIAAFVLLASACSTTKTAPAPAPEATAENAAKAIAAAEAANKKAAAVGYEWRDTGQLIKEAKDAVAAKDLAKAIKLAQQAEHQGKNAVKQHAEQMKAVTQY